VRPTSISGVAARGTQAACGKGFRRGGAGLLADGDGVAVGASGAELALLSTRPAGARIHGLLLLGPSQARQEDDEETQSTGRGRTERQAQQAQQAQQAAAGWSLPSQRTQ
jgi:hypothetical protein